MSVVDAVAVVLLTAGCGFYLAAIVGLLRFPDVHCRLHALTKADNLGLMLVCAALAVYGGSLRVALLLVIVWLFALVAAAISAHLIARHAQQQGDQQP
ncbi:MAG: cation:proton antiporter [Rhodospirillales bacterium]